MGKFILEELGTNLKNRGNEIFFTGFIQYVRNIKNSKLIELPNINKNRTGYSKSISKVLFGTLNSGNKLDVPLCAAPIMSDTLKNYPLAQPIYFSLSIEGVWIL